MFDRAGAVAALMRELDWSRPPVGPVDGWPQSLKATIRRLAAGMVADAAEGEGGRGTARLLIGKKGKNR